MPRPRGGVFRGQPKIMVVMLPIANMTTMSNMIIMAHITCIVIMIIM